MGSRRVLQMVLGGVFGLAALASLGAAVANWERSGAAGLIVPFLMTVFCALAVGMLQLQVRSVAKAGARVRANIDAIAASVFDAPGAVREGYDLSATAGEMAAAFSGLDSGAGFTTDGTHRGARVSVASHVSTLGRQIGELHHTYSHVLVDVLGLQRQFRISRERASSKVALAVGAVSDATVGDAAFDRMFLVQADEALARDVLDDSIRARLLDLQARVGSVSVDMGVGGMTLLLTKQGLALRWPGDIDPPLAKHIRELLLDIRERLLAYENRAAARTVATSGERGGYRIASDVIDDAARAEGERETARAEAEAAEAEALEASEGADARRS